MLRLIPAAIVLAVFATTAPAGDIQTLQSVGDHSETRRQPGRRVMHWSPVDRTICCPF